MNSNKLRKLFCVVLAVVLCVSMYGCKTNEAQETPSMITMAGELAIPQASNSGGYEINTEKMRCVVVVDGQCKYSCFESYGNGHKIEFYSSQNEIVLIDTKNGISKYHTELIKNNGQNYINPMSRVYDELKDLDFKHSGTDKNLQIFTASKTIVIQNNKQIKYNMYTIKLCWKDGKEYVFKYYEYSDGATLISAEAPNEINPLINKDTNWCVDLDSRCLLNKETDESIIFNVEGMQAGYGLSPNYSDETTTSTHTVSAYVNRDNQIEELKYHDTADGTKIKVILNPTIIKPNIDDCTQTMSDDEVQINMLLISMLETLI